MREITYFYIDENNTNLITYLVSYYIKYDKSKFPTICC